MRRGRFKVTVMLATKLDTVLKSICDARPLLPLDIDFSTFTTGDSVAKFLSGYDIAVSDYTVGTTPNEHAFVPDNVAIVDGVLQLTVSGGAGSGTVPSAEIATNFKVLYANITTRAKASSVPGVCHGFFSYKDNSTTPLGFGEIDIEILTSYITTGYGDGIVPPGLEFTNQAVYADGVETNAAVAYGFDLTADFHDYTIVWTSEHTGFYVDGVLKQTFTDNVPSIASAWIWNNWSDGDPNWTAGPPTEDATVEIERISGYYYAA
ncbi:glycoside hydrolase family 16 protein [Pseudohyphozyma bogoriensis]|nr:glycoside hydrolase family 16 protein [Pseudohyphozyma bogoriensis]